MKNILFILLLIIPLFSAGEAIWQEEDWKTAWNAYMIKGKLEAPFYYTSKHYCKVDILTENYAIEVDHVYKFSEGIGQALHYARVTERKPGLALFMDHTRDTREKYEYAKKLAEDYDIKVWLINDVVSKPHK